MGYAMAEPHDIKSLFCHMSDVNQIDLIFFEAAQQPRWN